MTDNTEEIINKFDQFFAELRRCGFEDWGKIGDTMDYVRKLRSGESTDKPMPLPKGFIELPNKGSGRAFVNVNAIVAFAQIDDRIHIWCVNDNPDDHDDSWNFHGALDELKAKIAEAQR